MDRTTWSSPIGRTPTTEGEQLHAHWASRRRPDATPTGTHAEHIRAGVRAGLPIFCEKPVAGDIDETRDVLAEVTAAAVPLHVGFQRRFDAGYQTVRQAVRDGRPGRL
ncbi:Gfo/Idh/MocA family oxidoreductase [Actinoallomurus iriomotensis]|uniref:Gfo/Idh/MocA family oxidoreductase n=1 Tax=Actinoallomurus iriomotensis TaxID=478107 RepID=UPI0025561C9B|nr:Gfo/Idh/MocA family oxidoreductase [Actinoallomurus iriomotensis]